MVHNMHERIVLKELLHDTSGSPETPEARWKHETLYVVLDSVHEDRTGSRRTDHFMKCCLYFHVTVFHVSGSEMYNTVYDLSSLNTYCD